MSLNRDWSLALTGILKIEIDQEDWSANDEEFECAPLFPPLGSHTLEGMNPLPIPDLKMKDLPKYKIVRERKYRSSQSTKWWEWPLYEKFWLSSLKTPERIFESAKQRTLSQLRCDYKRQKRTWELERNSASSASVSAPVYVGELPESCADFEEIAVADSYELYK